VAAIQSTESVCDQWGTLSAAGHVRGRHRPQNDTWIAAVALTYGLPLATLNLKAYEDFEADHGLRIVRR
jgi:hypothetical protein